MTETPVFVQLVALAPLVALVGSLVNGLFGRGLREPASGVVASAAVGVGFVLSLVGFVAYPAGAEGYRYVVWEFLRAGGLSVDVAFLVDQLSLVMCLVITGVGFLIHVYSIGYMRGDPGHARYFSQLNLFVAAMLVLVLADSLPLMFVGWEGVGVCSFLLIGFWYEQRANADAARKAFIVNRVGDVGFLIAMFLTFKAFGTLELSAVNAAAPAFAYGAPVLTAIGLLLLLAAAGKSAQLPLQLWLPDAMAGPTPVSALIHAATMVTAGVYLIARTGAVFAQAPAAAATVAWVGALTALVAAVAAFAQTDIKRVLAYSTISQVGFMVAAVGAGAYWAGIFHVVTHACFKALLFLGAGSVIHALGGEQDLRRMGGLGRRMRVTGTTSLIATLAIAGVPLLSGFFSKDAILSGTLTSSLLDGYGAGLLFALLLLTAVLTAAYMFRWYYLVFAGDERLTAEAKAHVHESPAVMTTPLVALAVGSVLAGYLGVQAFIGRNLIAEWLGPVTAAVEFRHLSLGAEWALVVASALAAAAGLGAGYWLYHVDKGRTAKRLEPTPVAALARSGMGFDAAAQAVLVRPGESVAAGLAALDREVVDGGLAATVSGVPLLARLVTLWQTGYVRLYALAMLAGAAVVAAVALFAGVLR